jgi:hypothetical protein
LQTEKERKKCHFGSILLKDLAYLENGSVGQDVKWEDGKREICVKVRNKARIMC